MKLYKNLKKINMKHCCAPAPDFGIPTSGGETTGYPEFGQTLNRILIPVISQCTIIFEYSNQSMK